MFRATMPDARLWRSLLSAISTLVDEANFNATPEGLKLRSMDPSHVAMIDFELPSSAFKEYVCSGPSRIRIGLESMLKLLKRAKAGESVELVYDEESKKIQMTLRDSIKKVYSIPTLESAEEETPTPKVEFNSTIKITSTALKEIIEDTREVSDNVRFEATPEMFTIIASTELSSGRFEINKGAEALLEIRVKENSTATYNLSYLADMVKAGADASEILTLEFSTNMPLKLGFDVAPSGQIVYYLAPRIEAE
ncbi:MAG: proliferating cell nuclear antigen (pcna) [Candidatus Bathyarchaeia archaeon]